MSSPCDCATLCRVLPFSNDRCADGAIYLLYLELLDADINGVLESVFASQGQDSSSGKRICHEFGHERSSLRTDCNVA